MAVEPMSPEEIEAFAHRLEDFAAALPPGEEALLRAILTRAGDEQGDEVEAHGLARTSIAALVLAAAGTLGAANATAGQIHHASPAVSHVHHVVSTVGDDKGGAETITYTGTGGAGSR